MRQYKNFAKVSKFNRQNNGFVKKINHALSEFYKILNIKKQCQQEQRTLYLSLIDKYIALFYYLNSFYYFCWSVVKYFIKWHKLAWNSKNEKRAVKAVNKLKDEETYR